MSDCPYFKSYTVCHGPCPDCEAEDMANLLMYGIPIPDYAAAGDETLDT